MRDEERQRNLGYGPMLVPNPVLAPDDIVERCRDVHEAIMESIRLSPRNLTRAALAEEIDLNESVFSQALNHRKKIKVWEEAGKHGKEPDRKNVGEHRLEEIILQSQSAMIAQYFAKVAGGKFVPYSETERREEETRKRAMRELEENIRIREEAEAKIRQLRLVVASRAA